MRVLHVLTALCALGCAESAPQPVAPKGEQTYEQAISLICNVDRELNLDASADVLDVAERRHEFLHERVKNPDGIYYYTIFRTQDPAQQAGSLRQEARELELRGCPLADSLEREGG